MDEMKLSEFKCRMEKMAKNLEEAVPTILDLCGMNIGDEGAKEVANLIKLDTLGRITEINLENNCIQDRGAIAIAEALKNNKTVVKLNLKSNSIGDDGAAAIIMALNNNNGKGPLGLFVFDKFFSEPEIDNSQSISEINLSDNKIGDAGAKAIAKYLVRSCRASRPSIIKIYMRNNPIKDDGFYYLIDALNHLHTGYVFLQFKDDDSKNKLFTNVLHTKTKNRKLMMSKQHMIERIIEIMKKRGTCLRIINDVLTLHITYTMYTYWRPMSQGFTSFNTA